MANGAGLFLQVLPSGKKDFRHPLQNGRQVKDAAAWRLLERVLASPTHARRSGVPPEIIDGIDPVLSQGADSDQQEPNKRPRSSRLEEAKQGSVSPALRALCGPTASRQALRTGSEARTRQGCDRLCSGLRLRPKTLSPTTSAGAYGHCGAGASGLREPCSWLYQRCLQPWDCHTTIVQRVSTRRSSDSSTTP